MFRRVYLGLRASIDPEQQGEKVPWISVVYTTHGCASAPVRRCIAMKPQTETGQDRISPRGTIVCTR